MKQKELAELTNEEVLQEAKTIKTNNIYDAAIFGFLIGVAVYSAVRTPSQSQGMFPKCEFLND